MNSENQRTEDPKYSMEDWRYEVQNGDTSLGYDEWVDHQRESNDEPTSTVIQINLNDLAEELRKRGIESDAIEKGVWTNTLMDALEEMTGIESHLIRILNM